MQKFYNIHAKVKCEPNVKHNRFSCKEKKNYLVFYMHKLNVAKCLIIIYIFVFGIISKNSFCLTYAVFGRVLPMPQIHVRVSLRVP